MNRRKTRREKTDITPFRLGRIPRDTLLENLDVDHMVHIGGVIVQRERV